MKSKNNDNNNNQSTSSTSTTSTTASSSSPSSSEPPSSSSSSSSSSNPKASSKLKLNNIDNTQTSLNLNETETITDESTTTTTHQHRQPSSPRLNLNSTRTREEVTEHQKQEHHHHQQQHQQQQDRSKNHHRSSNQPTLLVPGPNSAPKSERPTILGLTTTSPALRLSTTPNSISTTISTPQPSSTLQGLQVQQPLSHPPIDQQPSSTPTNHPQTTNIPQQDSVPINLVPSSSSSSSAPASSSSKLPSLPLPIGTRKHSVSSKPGSHLVSKLTGNSIPKLKKVSSKVFSQVHHPFSSSSASQQSPPSSPRPSGSRKFSLSPRSYLNPSAHKSSTEESSRHSGNSFDYDPISTADTRSFEDDGQEGSLQDALEVRDPPTISEDTSPTDPKGRSNPSSPQQTQASLVRLKSKKTPKPGKQHGATSFPASPKATSQSQSHPPPSPTPKQSSHTRKSIDPTSMVHQEASRSSSERLSTSPPIESLPQRPKALSPDFRQTRESTVSLVVGGPAALPSRLSGWFQQAFSSSTANLPMLIGNSTSSTLPAALGSPERARSRKSNKTPNAQEQDDHVGQPVPEPKRSPIAASHPQQSGNIRSIGNFFDKAVNYMFDTDAHSYDTRHTGDLWVMGGQKFVGVWKWEEHREKPGLTEDSNSVAGPSAAGGGGAGSGSDASYAPHHHHPKKRSALRRVTVGKTKGLFKNHHNQPHHTSSSETSRKSSEPINSHHMSSLSPSPTPSPEPLACHTNLYRASDDATSLPSTVTHSYPPLFYHAFASVVGLTYRSDFPPIPCAPDRLRATGIGGAGARVGGMLASLSLSIGRAGKKSKNDRSRSPSPSPNLCVEPTEGEERLSDYGPIKGLTSDVGWGCMLRTGQSLLANALLVAHLGRDWRRPLASINDSSDPLPADPVYSRLLSWFIDSSSNFAPFSVHRFALKGKELGKEVGEWFGPSTAAGAIKSLTNDFLAAGLGVVTDVDGTVYRSDVYATSVMPNLSSSKSRISESLPTTTWDRPVLVLVNVRLGIDGVNPSYYEAIKATFTFPQSVGIAGGRPSSSYYFCGFQGDSLFYIDPHHSRPAIPLEELPASLSAPALKVALRSRFTDLPIKNDGDWEQISSNDTDSLLSGSCVSDGIPRSRGNPQSPRISPPSVASNQIPQRPSECFRDTLDDFYARAYPDQVLRTFHPEKVRRMTLSALDPSMLVGFLVRDPADWEDLTARIRSSKPPLFHIADRTPSWMRPDPDHSRQRRSNDFRPSDDSDLGIDSWSEPDEWAATSRTDEISSAESHEPEGESDGEEVEEGENENEADEYGQEEREVDYSIARSTGTTFAVEDSGWDDVQRGDWNLDRSRASTSSVSAGVQSASSLMQKMRIGGNNDTVRSKGNQSNASPVISECSRKRADKALSSSLSSSSSSSRSSSSKHNSVESAGYFRPPVNLPHRSFAQSAEAMKLYDGCDLNSSQTSGSSSKVPKNDDDDRAESRGEDSLQSNTIGQSSKRRNSDKNSSSGNSSVASGSGSGRILSNVFPTHQLVVSNSSSSSKPYYDNGKEQRNGYDYGEDGYDENESECFREEPRSRNVSAATVRASNSEDYLGKKNSSSNGGSTSSSVKDKYNDNKSKKDESSSGSSNGQSNFDDEGGNDDFIDDDDDDEEEEEEEVVEVGGSFGEDGRSRNREDESRRSRSVLHAI